jgi:hypothetical protein
LQLKNCFQRLACWKSSSTVDKFRFPLVAQLAVKTQLFEQLSAQLRRVVDELMWWKFGSMILLKSNQIKNRKK